MSINTEEKKKTQKTSSIMGQQELRNSTNTDP